MNVWSWLWVAWLALFAAIEVPAILRKSPREKPDTLSDHLARWFRIKTTAGKITWSVFILGLAFWVWLHILTDQAV